MPFHTSFRFRSYDDAHGQRKPHPPPERIYGPVSYIGPLTVGAYLIETSDGLVVVDTGEGKDGDLLPQNIRKLGLDPADVRLILNTHWHFDHVGGNARLVELSGARAMIHERDADVVESGTYPDGNHIIPFKVSRRLKDGDSIEQGGVVFRTVHCPGQSAGSAVFLATVNGPDGPCRALFAGDATGFKSDVKLLDLYGYPGVCADYRRSVNILKRLEFDLYAGGHPHQVWMEMRSDGFPFVTREEWLKLVETRHGQMENFVKEHPRYLDW
jgi:metallo-beta-lactamase class B